MYMYIHREYPNLYYIIITIITSFTIITMIMMMIIIIIYIYTVILYGLYVDCKPPNPTFTLPYGGIPS